MSVPTLVASSRNGSFLSQDAKKLRQWRSRIVQTLNILIRSTGGKVPIRSHVIEASGSSEAWYVPLRAFTRCGLIEGVIC
jgi:hypothetical protein